MKVEIRFESNAKKTGHILTYLSQRWGHPGVVLSKWWEFRGVKTFAELEPGRLAIVSQSLFKTKNSVPDGGI